MSVLPDDPHAVASPDANTVEHFGVAAREAFLLDPQLAFLNHGSFGATPRCVRETQDAWRARCERSPVHFMSKVLEPALRAAADRLAAFLGARGADLVFVDNATSGINAVLRSLPLGPGDEVLYTNHGYGAVNQAVQFACRRSGAAPVAARIPFPIAERGQVLDALAAVLTERTRVAVIDHITSASGLVLPLAEMIALCRARGAWVIVDGAHAPGMLPLEIPQLDADFYAGNCHKWLCAPKGAGFLWVAPHAQARIDPLVISWGWGEGFSQAFDWPGTRDFSPWLAVPAALDFHHRVAPEQRHAYGNGLAARAADMIERAWGVAAAAPADMRAAMVTIALPTDQPATRTEADRIHDALYGDFGVEVPVFEFKGRLWVRISAQCYNVIEDYVRLLDGWWEIANGMAS
jgi:isopenicillin-N epimerase